MGSFPAALLMTLLQGQVVVPSAVDGGVDAAPPAAQAAPAQAAPAPAPAPDGGEPAVKPPVLTHFVPAVYPPDADAKRIAGSVTFSIVIDEKGAVGAVKVLDPGPHPGFAPAAEAAVKQFQFTPAVIGGKPTAVEI